MKEKLYPWLRKLTLRQLRGFSSVVRNGSISAAARDLHLTPPAVSLQIRDLEKSVGAPLLERRENRLSPTLVGKEVFTLAQHIESTLFDFGATVDALKGVDHGVVSVGVVSTARYFAPRVLAEFIKIYPDVKLQLLVGNRESTLAKLETMELDFAITGLPPNHFEVKC